MDRTSARSAAPAADSLADAQAMLDGALEKFDRVDQLVVASPDVINNSGHAVCDRTDKCHQEHKEQKGLVGGLFPICVGPFSLKTRLVLCGHGAVCELGLHDHGLSPSGNEQTKARCSCRPMALS
jgi:hypothetical protein